MTTLPRCEKEIIRYIYVQGVVEQDGVDSFNIPHVYPSMKEMRRVVEKNGCFEIVRMEHGGARGSMDIESAIMHLRACSEGTMAKHFGNEIVKELFERAIQQKLNYAHILVTSGVQNADQLFAALKRK